MKETHNSFSFRLSECRTAIMGLSMLSIMLFHQYFVSAFPFNFFHVFGFWGVDIFLFLSGMGLVNSLEKNSTLHFYKRRLLRLVPSCLICGAVKYFIFISFTDFFSVLKTGLNLGMFSIASMDLWFIHTIFLFYLITPVLYYLLNEYPVITSLCIILVFFINGLTIRPMIGFDWLSPLGVLSWSIERLPVFATGMLISIKRINVDRKMFLFFVFFMVAVVIRILGLLGMNMPILNACQIFALVVGMPALIEVCRRILSRLPKQAIHPIIFFGKYSLELYLVHEFVFWSIKVNFVEYAPWLLMFFGFLLSCSFAYLCKQIVYNFILKNVN